MYFLLSINISFKIPGKEREKKEEVKGVGAMCVYVSMVSEKKHFPFTLIGSIVLFLSYTCTKVLIHWLILHLPKLFFTFLQTSGFAP